MRVGAEGDISKKDVAELQAAVGSMALLNGEAKGNGVVEYSGAVVGNSMDGLKGQSNDDPAVAVGN